jgi:hypothetical protein
MSEWEVSKYLKFQDKNNDGLSDVCEPEKPIEEAKCPSCLPKPTALVPRWRSRGKNDPFLNERRCLYQISYATPFTDTGAFEKYGPNATDEQAEIALKERSDAFKDNAAEALARYYNKDITKATIEKIVDSMEWTDWDLDVRPMSHLKFLYSVPFDVIDKLADAPPQEDEAMDESDVEVTVIGPKIMSNMKRIRRTLDFYSSNLKVYRALEGKNVLFVKGGVFNLDLYGDSAPFGNSITERLIPELTDFLDRYNITLFPIVTFFNSNWDVASKIDFVFSHDYKLKIMRVHAESGCPPVIFKQDRLSSLTNRQAWSDPTAVAYFAKQNDMIRDILARQPRPWLDFIIDHTYPTVKSSKTHDPIKISNSDDTESERTIVGCIGDALEGEFKQLGEDIKDDIFGMADALASQFHKSLCLGDYKDFLDEEFNIGKIDDPGANPNLSREKREKNIFQYAQEQAFLEIKEKDVLFAGLCARMSSIFGGSQQNMLDKIHRDGLDPTMLCGLYNMMLDVIECLFKGLSFEEILAAAVRSALRAMSIEDFGFLFIGLPPDKQAKMDAMVKQKLASGDIFSEGSSGQRLSDSIETRNRDGSSSVPQNAPFFAKSIKIEKPWENKALVEEQKRNYMREGPLSGMSPTGVPPKGGAESQLSRATAVSQIKNVGADLDPNIILQAYVAALIEEYSDNLTDLVKMLDKLPGAPIIGYIIATLDCPRPPLFNPTLAEFLGDLALPFCKNTYPIAWPRIDNLFAWIPKITDILAFLFWLAMYILQQIIIIIIMRLMVWLCELLADAICKALETVGDIAMALPAMIRGDKTFGDVIKESICGPEADEEQVNETIQGIFQSFGQDAEAFADKEKVLSFAEDLSSAVSRKELVDAIAGEPSGTFLGVIESLIEFEYPEYAGTFGNRAKASAFFGNIGKLMPLEARDLLNDFRNRLDPNDMMPANPSICATPEEVEEFCNQRAALLEGRATPAQIQGLCDTGRDTLKAELQDIGDIFQKGLAAHIEEQMPPIMSPDPTCDDGILPYEPPQIRESVTAAAKTTFMGLEGSFKNDMLGDGTKRASDWGWLNMVLSDTMGRPYTSHRTSTIVSGIFTAARYVDFYVPYSPTNPDENSIYAPHLVQYGAYPKTIAMQLKNEIENVPVNHTFKSTNDVQDAETFYRSYEELGFIKQSGGFFGLGSTTDVDVELTILPDYGYNVKPVVEWSSSRVKFIKYARKKSPDLFLSYRDGGPFGTPETANNHTMYSYGFDLQLFTSDIKKQDGSFFQRSGDTTRMIVDKTVNLAFSSMGDSAFAAGETDDEGGAGSDTKSMQWQEYEFIAKDRTLENPLVNSGVYPNFDRSLVDPVGVVAPQVTLLNDMIYKESGDLIATGQLESVYNEVMNKIFTVVASDIAANKPAFTYGAPLDTITKKQLEYGFKEGAEFIPLFDYIARERSRDGNWKMSSLPFGISRMQYDEEELDGPTNRVIYLNPAEYGGKNWNPPFYVKPPPASGWVGIAQALFPESSPCEPRGKSFIDFEDVKDSVEASYSKIAEDKRLQKDPNCTSEKPYNRILHRGPKSNIEGVVKAACKVFAGMEMLKAFPVFSKFYPDFKNNYSNLYAAYIVEVMEEELKDAQNDVLELFSPFKDDEFWYAFLEQAVQTYARLLETGDIREPSDSIIAALQRLENFEQAYSVPSRLDFINGKAIGDTSPNETFKNYRYEKVLEAVLATEDDAKIILAEFVSIELESLGDNLITCLEKAQMEDINSIHRNLGYYVLQNLSLNTNLQLNKEIKEELIDFPTEEGSSFYTNGGELIYEDGVPYIGYYHAHRNEEGKIVFMEGEEHSDLREHEVLHPLANRIKLPIGTIGSLVPSGLDTTLPFLAETYLNINGQEYSVEKGMAKLRANPYQDKNISDVYPGTMELIIAEDGPNEGKAIGTKGHMGVRYGLKLSIIRDRSRSVVVRTEVDALDIPLGRIQPLEPDSKLMFCLINNLVDEPSFKLLTEYALSLPKILSTMAIYSSLGFVSSIGEIQNSINQEDISQKPGRYVTTYRDEENRVNYTAFDGADGWATKKQRYPGYARGYGYGYLHFDRWNRSELSKTKAKLKGLFKGNYFIRRFDPGKDIKNGGFGLHEFSKVSSRGPGKSIFASSSFLRHLPWWKQKMLRSNPFDANGNICKKS